MVPAGQSVLYIFFINTSYLSYSKPALHIDKQEHTQKLVLPLLGQPLVPLFAISSKILMLMAYAELLGFD